MAVLVYRNKKYDLPELHPVHDDIPAHIDADTFAEMLDSMGVYGFNRRKPILRQKSTGKVVIGRRRLLCCKILKIEPVFQDVDWTEQEVLEQVRQDELHRRHLGEGERALVAVRLNEREKALNGGRGSTQKEMADKAGVGEKAVRNAAKVHPALQPVVGKGANRISLTYAVKLSQAHADGGLPEAELKRIAGSDDVPGEAAKALGTKTHGGKREKKPEPEVESGTPLDGSAPPPKPAKVEKKSEEIKDKLGQVCPPSVRDTFGDPALPELLARMRAAADELKWLKERVKQVWTGKQEYFPFCHWEEAHDSVSNAAHELAVGLSQVEAGEPYCVCPKCKGEQCPACQQAGYWPKHRADNLKGQYGS